MPETILEARNLTKVYGQNTIFKNINLKVKEGEAIVIIGPSGTGKSTLLRCMNLLTRADGGQILLDGEDITAKGYNEDKVRQHIGMVFQNFLLFNHLTALDNVMIGLTRVKKMPREQAVKKAMEELRRVGLLDRADHYPGQLSGGQQQRVAIARAVVANPKLILADEPTGNLDSKNGMEVMNLLTELNREGTTIVMVTHSMHDSEFAHRVINLFDGQVITEEVKKQMGELLV